MAAGSNNTASLQTADTTRCPTIHYSESRHDDVVVDRYDTMPYYPLQRKSYDDVIVDELDCEIEYDEHGHRYALVALPKPVPMAGMSKRWYRCSDRTWNNLGVLIRYNLGQPAINEPCCENFRIKNVRTFAIIGEEASEGAISGMFIHQALLSAAGI